jgi:hypothetical protein
MFLGVIGIYTIKPSVSIILVQASMPLFFHTCGVRDMHSHLCSPILRHVLTHEDYF